MESKKHFKLYKSGKKWIVAAIATVAITTGVIFEGGVKAASTGDLSESEQAALTPEKGQIPLADDQSKSNDHEDLKNTDPNQSLKSVKPLANDQSEQPTYNQQDQGNYGNFDSIQVNHNQLHVEGWQATNQAAQYGNDNRFLIAIGHNDQGQQAELGRTKLNASMVVNRPDVQAVHNVYNASQSGFNADIKLDLNKLSVYRNAIQIISRYSGVPNGNSQYADYVSAPVIFDRNNYVWLDDMNVADNQLHVTGWNATNKVLGKNNHYIILFDRTLGHELARTKVTPVVRPDVANTYPQVLNAQNSGFDTKFSLNNVDLSHELQIISRFSDDANGEGNYVQYWFAPKQLLTTAPANVGYVDQFNISKSGKVTVSGWHASDVADVETNRYLILFDQTAQRQVAAAKIDSINRPDAAKAYPQIKDAQKAGYNVTLEVKPQDLQYGHQYSIVSRYSTDPKGNGNDGAKQDLWSAPIILNQSAYAIDQIKLANHNVQVTGWMASDAVGTQSHPFIIVMSNGKEVARQAVTLALRPDVAKVYPQISSSSMSGFKANIQLPNLTNQQLQNIQVLLRFSAAVDGNPTPSLGVTDQLSGKYNLMANQGYFDFVKVNEKTVEVAGWHASSVVKPYQYLIVLQNGHEVGRSKVMGSEGELSRPDVNRVYPNIYNSSQSGFQGSVLLTNPIRNGQVQVIHRFTDDPAGNGDYINIVSPTYQVKGSYQSAGSLNSDSMRAKRDLTAQRIAQKLMQSQQTNVLYDWTDQSNNYQEFAVHDIAQELAQGDVNNDLLVIAKKLANNDLLNGKVISTAIFDLPQTMDYDRLADDFVNNIPSKANINNSVVGVGVTDKKLAIVLFKPGENTVPTKVSSQLVATVTDAYKNAGVNVDVINGLNKGMQLDSTNIGTALQQPSSLLLQGPAGQQISYDALKAIFAALPGNSVALEGVKTYYHDNDPYHYQFWLAGNDSNDKLNQFLALNKGAKYGDQLKIAYTATLVYGAEKGTQPTDLDQTPTSKKSADEIALAYQKGTETGARYDTVKVEPIANMKQDTIRGVDVSSYLALVNNGVQFYDFNGQPADLMKVLADAGVNYIRIRLWVDPYNPAGESYGGGNDDEATVLKIAQNAKKYGMKVLLGLHYSDFWADPATQLIPKAWKNLNDQDLNAEVYLYTKKLVNDFTKAGITIDMAQLGNEITKGILGVTGNVKVWQNEPQVSRITSYLSSASRAFRESTPATQLAVHIETPDMHNYDMIMNALQNHGVDYDVLGSSYYPFWGWGGNNPDNIANIEKMVKDKYGKKFMVAESGWPFTLQNSDGQPNNVSWDPGHYAVSPQGQVDEISAMYKAVLSNDNGLGAFYWESAWIPVKAGWDNWEYNKLMGDLEGTGWASINSRGYYPDSKIMYEGKSASGGTSWDNNTLFDDQGHPLQSLMMYKGFLTGYQSPANVTGGVDAKISKVYQSDNIKINNGLKEGDSLTVNQVLNQTGQNLLNGITNTPISKAAQQVIFGELKDGFKSDTYTDQNGMQYHYEFWLAGTTATEKLNHFLQINQNIKYGQPLHVDYTATLVRDQNQVTSPLEINISEVWGLDGVKINNPLKVNDSMPVADATKIKQAVNKLLTGEQGTLIDDETFKQLSSTLPGSTTGLNGEQVYTMKDGNQYRYQYWLTTKDISAANKGAKFGDKINLTYSASLKWIDPKAK